MPHLVVVEGDVAPVNLLLVVVDLLHLEHVPGKDHTTQRKPSTSRHRMQHVAPFKRPLGKGKPYIRDLKSLRTFLPTIDYKGRSYKKDLQSRTHYSRIP